MKFGKRAYVRLISEIEDSINNQELLISTNQASNKIDTFHILNNNNDDLNYLQKWLNTIKVKLYQYILHIYHELKYGGIIEDIFTEMRNLSDKKLSKLCPKSIEKFVSVYSNINSDNQEDWANAVHSCRRILLDLADALCPAQDKPATKKGKTIQLGRENYINRLIQFIESKKGSKTYERIVGTELESIGKRLKAVNEASNKGTHDNVSKFEAKRYIIHTYLLISDIIALTDEQMC